MQITTTSSPARKLLDQVHDKIRFKHYSLSTENTYVSWIKQYILFNGKRYPAEMGGEWAVRWMRCDIKDKEFNGLNRPFRPSTRVNKENVCSGHL